jgi:hypothetical protein
MDSYNIYMDETPMGADFDDPEGFDVEFRVVPGSRDETDHSEAVIAGLDLIDLINLRDALQMEIDNYALAALQAAAETVVGDDEA